MWCVIYKKAGGYGVYILVEIVENYIYSNTSDHIELTH